MVKPQLWKVIVAVTLAATLVVPGVSATSTVFQSPPPPPPPNDYFADALIISQDTYNSGWIDVSLATTEVGEQTSACGHTTQHTIWYAFTAPSAGQINVSIYGNYYYYTYDPTIGLNVFQGPVGGFPTLEAYCTTWSPAWGGGNLSFTAQAGTTYYFQVATTYALTDNQVVFNFQYAPPPPPPVNDNFATAIDITGTYFYQSADVSSATTEVGERTTICHYTAQQTIWYKFTAPANGTVNSTLGSNSGATVLAAYLADSPGLEGLVSKGCASYGNNLWINVEANKAYYFQAGTIGSSMSSELYFSMSFTSAPTNDNFADATTIAELPFFNGATDMTAASREAGEPESSCGSMSKTVWYAYTPSESGSLSQRTDIWWQGAVVAVFTGESMGTLGEVTCRYRYWPDSSFLTFHVNSGTTYYFQVGTNDNPAVPFYLQVAEPPQASFWYSPYDPSAFDTVYFNNNSSDPANVGIQSQTWDFGDGSTSTDWSPSHKYAKDGDYTVKLTVNTPDRRTGSISQTVRVKTHDVAITKFTVPQSASTGQTRQIVVGLNSKRYVEDVEVQLYKSTPGGYQWVGTLRQTVPVRPSNRTTDFLFSYTFTKDDAAIGKVTFRAVAYIINARDALPADNESIASPTKVSK
jgi:PKD repeat protein